MSTRLEHFPNELIDCVLTYFDIPNLYHSFWGINQRFNNVLHSLPNLSLKINKNDSLLIDIFAQQITRLFINTSEFIDLNQLPNLHSLELSHSTDIQMAQIRSDIIPNLTYLSLSTRVHISLPFELVEEIFSTAFRFLRHVRLGRLDTLPESQSTSLHTLYITCTDPNIISQILLICPNLLSFHVTYFGHDDDDILPPSSSSYDHSLKRFSLHDPYYKLSFDTINILFLYMPKVEYLSLQFLCNAPFIRLIESIQNRLGELNRFECDILESLNNEISDMGIIHRMNECFQCIQCIERDNNYRLFSTEND